jgi:hypothetical protein
MRHCCRQRTATALAYFERKGDVMDAGRVRERLARLEPT